MNDMYLLDLHNNKWYLQGQRGRVPLNGRCRHSFTAIDNKQFLVMGGYCDIEGRVAKSIEILHTDDMSWTKFDNIKSLFAVGRAAHKVVKVNEFGYMVCGGIVKQNTEPFFYLDLRRL